MLRVSNGGVKAPIVAQVNTALTDKAIENIKGYARLNGVTFDEAKTELMEKGIDEGSRFLLNKLKRHL